MRQQGRETGEASKGRGCRCGVRHGMHALGFIIGDGGGRQMPPASSRRTPSGLPTSCTLFLTLRQLASGRGGTGRAGLGWDGMGWATASAKRLIKVTGVWAGVVGEGLH